MFDAFVRPLLTDQVAEVLDVGCGTASLARRIAACLPEARVCASDKSEVMLKVAEHLANQEGLSRIEMRQWDVTREESFPFLPGMFDLVVSSVMTIYLSDQEARNVVASLAKRLNPGGILAFVEQDLMTDSLDDSSGLFLKIMEKDRRVIKPTQALGLRNLLEAAGLTPLPLASYVWSDERYGPYVRELLERIADVAHSRGSISLSECQAFKTMLNSRAEAGNFYYGLVYHRIAGRRV